MTPLSETTLSAVLPPYLRNDPQISALARAIDNHLIQIAPQLVLHLPRLDSLDHDVLDALATQYHVDFYQPESMTLETKRRLIRESLLQHFKLGTKFAVEKLLNTISRGASVSEWFQYGGKPYHFKIKLKGLPDFGDDDIIMNAINAAKNVRSWLDDFDFDLSKNHPDHILNVAQILHSLGKLYFNNPFIFNLRQSLSFHSSNVVAGKIFQPNHFTMKVKSPRQVAFSHLLHGSIRFKTTSSGDWWTFIHGHISDATVIRHYFNDDELQPGQPEIFPTNIDFLRLYFTFHDSNRLRFITLFNPKPDIQPSDILNLNTKTKNFLTNKNGDLSDSIIRAVYCRKHSFKIL